MRNTYEKLVENGEIMCPYNETPALFLYARVFAKRFSRLRAFNGEFFKRESKFFKRVTRCNEHSSHYWRTRRTISSIINLL